MGGVALVQHERHAGAVAHHLDVVVGRLALEEQFAARRLPYEAARGKQRQPEHDSKHRAVDGGGPQAALGQQAEQGEDEQKHGGSV